MHFETCAHKEEEKIVLFVVCRLTQVNATKCSTVVAKKQNNSEKAMLKNK